MLPTVPILLAYVGPETILPVSSALAAFGGLLLVFGRSIKLAVCRCFRMGRRPDHLDSN